MHAAEIDHSTFGITTEIAANANQARPASGLINVSTRRMMIHHMADLLMGSGVYAQRLRLSTVCVDCMRRRHETYEMQDLW